MAITSRPQLQKYLIVFIVCLQFIFAIKSYADEKPEIFVQTGHSVSINAIAFSPDGKYALSGSADQTIKLWDVKSGREIRTFTGLFNGTFSLAFSQDGKYAVSASGDNTLKLWDITTGQQIRQFIPFQNP